MEGVVVSRRYAAPPEKVFAVFSDLDAAASRIPAIKAVEILEGPGNPLGMGTRWRETRVVMGREAKEVMWITAFEPGRMYRAEAESHGMHYESTFRFRPDGDGTVVEMEFRGRALTFAAKLMAAAMGAMMRNTLRKCCQEDLDALAPYCEGKG